MTTLDLSLDNFFGAGVTTDTDIAIAQTRSVFESVPAAGAVLSYLEATLAAGAEVREAAEWRERALKAEAVLAGYFKDGIQPQTRMDAGVEAATSPALSEPIITMSATTGLLRRAIEPIITEGTNLVCTACGNTSVTAEVLALDQAAAAMAAESAQMLTAAERMAARTGSLAELSKEVFNMSNMLQQPVDLVMQLLLLAEVRRIRIEAPDLGRPLFGCDGSDEVADDK